MVRPSRVLLALTIVAALVTAGIAPAHAAVRPRTGTWSLTARSGHVGTFSFVFTVGGTTRGISYLFTQNRLPYDPLAAFHTDKPCVGKAGFYAFWADAVTKAKRVPITNGGFAYRDPPLGTITPGGFRHYITGRFTTSTRASGRAFMRLFIPASDGNPQHNRECQDAGGLAGTAWRARWIADSHVRLAAPSVTPGALITVRGSGFVRRRLVRLYVPGTVNPRLYTFRADGRGRFGRRVRIGRPGDGIYRVIATQLPVRDYTGGGGVYFPLWSSRVHAVGNFRITRGGPAHKAGPSRAGVSP